MGPTDLLVPAEAMALQVGTFASRRSTARYVGRAAVTDLPAAAVDRMVHREATVPVVDQVVAAAAEVVAVPAAARAAQAQLEFSTAAVCGTFIIHRTEPTSHHRLHRASREQPP